jgi:Uma2 family endonuclease
MSLALPHPAYTDEPLFRLTVEQYHELIRSGTLSADDPVELLEGLLVYQMPKNTPHATATRLCRRVIELLLPSGWFYDSQEPITLSDGEPEPDGLVVRGRIEDYAKSHPAPADVGLVIEISDTTLDRDLGLKLRSYARAGITIYWVLDLSSLTLHVYTDPDTSSVSEPVYRQHEQFHVGDSVPFVLDGQQFGAIPIESLLPPR